MVNALEKTLSFGLKKNTGNVPFFGGGRKRYVWDFLSKSSRLFSDRSIDRLCSFSQSLRRIRYASIGMDPDSTREIDHLLHQRRSVDRKGFVHLRQRRSIPKLVLSSVQVSESLREEDSRFSRCRLDFIFSLIGFNC